MLRHLQQNYYKKIDFIYIDPPYNTGSDGFVYPDSFEYDDETLKNMFGLNDEDLARMKSIQGKSTHSAWLTFMYPRLYLAKKLLTDEGVIFVSIDDNEQANLKLLMDDIFGEVNFVENFIWKSSTGGGIRAKHVNTAHQYIFLYAKNVSNLDTLYAPLSKKARDLYRNENEKGKYRDKDFAWKNSSENPNQKYDITAPDGQIIHPKDGYIVRFVEERFKKELNEDNVTFKETTNGPFVKKDGTQADWNIYIKKYLGDGMGAPVSILPKNEVGLNNNGTSEIQELFIDRVFNYPKPTTLLKYILNIGSNKDSIILDFFAGSSTTADAVMQLNAEDGGNRQFIMCTLPEKTYTVNSNGKEVPTKGGKAAYDAGFKSIDEISRERIRRASAKIQEKTADLPENFDGGFKHFRFVQPNKDTLDQLEYEDAIQQDLFDDMISSFSSESLNLDGEASGFDTILQTYLVKDNYPFDVQMDMLDIAGIDVPYVNEQRIYIITNSWEAAHTRELVNAIGTGRLIVQTIVVYGHTISMESLRELEIALKQLEQSVDLQVRY